MYHRLLILIVCLLLAGCGAPPTTVPPAAPDVSVAPATVHQRFIEALQRNDRQTVVTLVSDHIPGGLIDTWLSEATALQRTSGTIGKFTGVHLVPPTEQGQGYTAISVWQHETGADCYRADLAHTDATWHVIDWRAIAPGTCPNA